MPKVFGFLAGMVGLTAPATASAAFAGALASGTTFATTFLGGTIGKLLTTVALSALQQALMGGGSSGGGLTISTTLRGEQNPETLILGRTATAGQLICPPMSHGNNNVYLTHVVELCSAPGAALERLILGDAYVDLGTTAHPDYGFPVLGDKYEGLVWINYYNGTQTAADPMLVSKYGSDPDRPWTAQMVGAGLCYAILTFKFDSGKSFVQVPRYRFEMRGIPLYDPRKDGSAGGVGPHRLNNPATWEQTVNPVVILWNLFRGITLPGGEVWGGQEALDALPSSVWWPAMTRCDDTEPVEGADPEPRYRCGIEAALSQEPAAVATELLKACSGQVADNAGTWGIRVGAPTLPAHLFSDADVLVSETQELDPFPTLAATYNSVAATYPDPETLWEPKDAPPRHNATWEAADRFGRRTADLDLPAVPYKHQVQRLMRAWIEAERRFARHILNLPPDATVLEPLDTAMWNSVRNQYTGKQFEVAEIVEDVRKATVQVSVREVDPADYAWSANFTLPAPAVSNGTTPPAPVVVSGFQAEPLILTGTGGEARRAAIKLRWDSALECEGISWELRLDSQPVAALRGGFQDVARGELDIAAGVLPATAYQARMRAIIGRARAWTAWLPVTSPDVRISEPDLAPSLVQDIAEAGNDAAAALAASGNALSTAQSIQNTVTADTAAAILAAQTARDQALGGAQTATTQAGIAATAADAALVALHQNPALTLAPLASLALFGTGVTQLPATFSVLAASAYLSDANGPHVRRSAASANTLISARPLALTPTTNQVFRVTARVRAVGAPLQLGFRASFIRADGTQHSFFFNPTVAVADGGIATISMVFGQTAGGLVTQAGGSSAAWSTSFGIRFSARNELASAGANFDLFSLQIEDVTAADQAARQASASATSATQAGASATQSGASAVAAEQERLAAQTARTGSETARDTSVTASQTASGAATSALTALNQISRVQVGSLVPNGNFATGDLSLWEGDAIGASAAVLARGASGSVAYANAPSEFFAILNRDDLAARSLDVRRLAVEPNERFAWQARFARSGTSSLPLIVSMVWFDAAGAQISVSDAPITVNTTLWPVSAGDFLAPANARSATFRVLRPAGGGATTSALCIGDVRLTRADPATLAVASQTFMTSAQTDGSIAAYNAVLQASVPGGLTATVNNQQTAITNLNSYTAATAALTVELSNGQIAGLRATVHNGAGGANSGSLLQLLGDQVVVPGSLTAQSLTIGNFQNLVPNAGFYNNLAGWSSAGSTVGSTVARYAGEYGVGIQISKTTGTNEARAITTDWQQAVRAVTVQPGQVYGLSLNVRRVAGVSGGNCGLQINWQRADGTNYTVAALVASVTPLDQTITLSTEITVPADAVAASFAVSYSTSVNSANGSVLITNIEMRPQAQAVHIANGAITAGKLSVNELSAIAANVGTLTAGVLRSANFVAGQTGAEINLTTGAAELNSLIVRDEMLADGAVLRKAFLRRYSDQTLPSTEASRVAVSFNTARFNPATYYADPVTPDGFPSPVVRNPVVMTVSAVVSATAAGRIRFCLERRPVGGSTWTLQSGATDMRVAAGVASYTQAIVFDDFRPFTSSLPNGEQEYRLMGFHNIGGTHTVVVWEVTAILEQMSK